MSKRSSKSEDSPIPKSQKLIGSQKSEDSLFLSGEPDFTFLQDSSQLNEPPDSEDFNFFAGSGPSTLKYPVTAKPYTIDQQFVKML